MLFLDASRSARRPVGQALLLVTFALAAMCGVLGLAVDLGWSYFVKKEAQAAADGAALAAVAKAQSLAGSPPYACGTGLECTSVVSCPTSGSLPGNLNSACVYAALNGFQQGGAVNVTVQAGVTTPAPTVPNVHVSYWVTVRVNRQVPQLFSAVLGNPTGLVSARATAALTNVIFNASLDLLNRDNDPSGTGSHAPGTGVNMLIQGNGTVTAPGGMLVASTRNQNTSSDGTGAANLGGNGRVAGTPFALFRGASGSCVGNGGRICDSSDWQTQLPTYNVADGKTFQDPTTLDGATTKTQPPLDLSQSTVCPVAGGQLSPRNVPSACTSNGGSTLAPGIYYASVSKQNDAATGAQLTFADRSTQFSDNGNSFGQFIFYGGLSTSAGNQTIRFAPGMYVFAGATGSNALFNVDNGTTILDNNTGNTQSDAGELFLYTNYNYNWGGGSTPDGVTTWASGGLINMAPAAIQAFGADKFQYQEGGFKTGNNQNSSVTLSGLNPDGTGVPGTLTNYKNFLFWQDRANSYVVYNNDGSIAISGTGCTNEIPTAAGSINNPCVNTLSNPNSPQMDLMATPHTHLSGYLYQPRGAWLYLQGAGSIGGPLRIITGALTLGGGPTVTLTGNSAPITITETALIE